MPLSFSSISHGTVAFGFFNIHTDLLLLENRFFFATEFCAALIRMAEGESAFETAMEAYLIEDRSRVGDLMGAIQGRVFTGFIGEVYRRFPFPAPRSGITSGLAPPAVRRGASLIALRSLPSRVAVAVVLEMEMADVILRLPQQTPIPEVDAAAHTHLTALRAALHDGH